MVVVRLGATVVGSLGVVGGLCPSVLVPLQEGSPLALRPKLGKTKFRAL